jgi:hypothetical protein
MSLENATRAEKKHLALVKELPCGVCGEPAYSDAHHIKEGDRRVSHYLVIPLCRNCHSDNHNGIHGQKAMWRVMKKTELSVLAETIEKLTGKRP